MHIYHSEYMMRLDGAAAGLITQLNYCAVPCEEHQADDSVEKCEKEIMDATRITYRLYVSGDHPRWCSVCGTQRATEHGKFVMHAKPDGKPCPNSGQKVNKTEQAG